MDNIDEWVRSEIEGRLGECCDERERSLVRSALEACERATVNDGCSLYEAAVALRGALLEIHGLDLCSYRRAEAEMDAGNIWNVTGPPGSMRSVLWNLDVALSMVEVHCSDDIALTFLPEVQQARAEEWDRFHVDGMLMEVDLDGPILTEA